MTDTMPALDGGADERALLGGALQNAEAARAAVADVAPWMFADGRLARAWSALRRVLADGDPGYLLDAVAADLAGDGGDAPTRADLHALAAEVPSAANASYYARRVVQAYARRELERIATPELLERGAELDTAALAGAIADRARHLRDLAAATPAPVVHDVADYLTAAQPAPVLWRDPEPSERTGADPDAVLSVGECAILASAGGLGKSTWTLEVAAAAVGAAELGADYGAACGLRVAAGPVLLVSFEDAPARIAHRLTWMHPGGAVPRGALHVAPDPAPLWLAAADRGGESHPGAAWDALWRAVRSLGARLVVIDPVSAALADVSTTETGPVRAFLRALTAEAETAGAGVLLVAHDTKAARNAAARGEDPGAGIVAGSAAWYDGARGVLSLARDPASDDRLLECVKANYGRTGWGARLRERTGAGGAFRGLILGARMARADLEAAKRPPKPSTAPTAATAANGTGKAPADVDTSEA